MFQRTTDLFLCRNDTPALYTVLPEKRFDRISGQMMASTHGYDLATAAAAASGSGVKKDHKEGAGGVDVSLNPEELDLGDANILGQKYEEGLKQQHLGKDDDFSDMVAEHAARQKVFFVILSCF